MKLSAALLLLALAGTAWADPAADFKQAYAAYQEQIAAGDKRAALPHAERAWSLGKQLFGDDDPNTEMLAYNYAATLMDTGNIPRAIEMLDDLEKAFQQRYGRRSTEWIAVMTDLGNAYASTFPRLKGGRDAIAAGIFDDAIKSAKDLYGEDSVDVELLRLHAGNAILGRVGLLEVGRRVGPGGAGQRQ